MPAQREPSGGDEHHVRHQVHQPRDEVFEPAALGGQALDVLERVQHAQRQRGLLAARPFQVGGQQHRHVSEHPIGILLGKDRVERGEFGPQPFQPCFLRGGPAEQVQGPVRGRDRTEAAEELVDGGADLVGDAAALLAQERGQRLARMLALPVDGQRHVERGPRSRQRRERGAHPQQDGLEARPGGVGEVEDGACAASWQAVRFAAHRQVRDVPDQCGLADPALAGHGDEVARRALEVEQFVDRPRPFGKLREPVLEGADRPFPVGEDMLYFEWSARPVTEELVDVHPDTRPHPFGADNTRSAPGQCRTFGRRRAAAVPGPAAARRGGVSRSGLPTRSRSPGRSCRPSRCTGSGRTGTRARRSTGSSRRPARTPSRWSA